ncbi:MAG: hypothetical protein IJI92_07585 [Erysipelotrichaceae bacterium]|nr:hypothetical protein [Erysipelotrichaceae bacterium]
MNKYIWKGIIVIMILSLFGCSSKLTCESAPLDGVSVNTNVTTEKNKAGNTVYSVVSDILNSSDREIMYVKFCIHFLDKEGNELFTFTPAWEGEDVSLKKGEKATYEVSFQHEEKASKIEVDVLELKDVTDIPTVHVPQKGEYLYEALNSEHMNMIKDEKPVNIYIHIDHMGAAETADVTDEETINELVEAFTKVKVGDETDVFVTDNYNGVRFTFADGTEYYVSFNLTTLELNINGNSHLYELEDFGPFWKLCNELAAYEEEQQD